MAQAWILQHRNLCWYSGTIAVWPKFFVRPAAILCDYLRSKNTDEVLIFAGEARFRYVMLSADH